MFIFKKHLDRRTFLHGVGATVALPLLDAMMPARTALAAAARPVPRLAFVYFPHGAIMDAWLPDGEGAAVASSRILEPLTPFADRVTIISGVENRHADGPVHAITPGTWLSGMPPPRERSEPGNWTTADQIAAAHLGGDTLRPSIEAATEEARAIGTGPWEGCYGPGYATTISFRASEPRRMVVSPRQLLDQLCARRAPAGARGGASTLDLVAPAAAALRGRLGPADRRTLRDYLDGIRDIERRVDRVEARRLASEPSQLTEDEFEDRLSLMFDLIALALRADITRVASFMMAAETSAMTYGHIGVPEPFHLLSHHQNDPARIEALVRIQRHHTRAFAGFVRTLADVPDGDASLLDRALILYGSNMSDSQRHDHYPLPLAIVGGGSIRARGHLRCPDRTPLSSVLLTLLHRAGVPVPSLGDSTDECAGL